MKRVIYLALLSIGSLSAMSLTSSIDKNPEPVLAGGNLCEVCPGGQAFCCSYTEWDNGHPVSTLYYYEPSPQ